MSLAHSPSVVMSGMTMYLDASNRKSYSGSGATTWIDQIQGLVFNSVGITNSLLTYNGASALAFNGSGYWECGTNYSLVDLGGDCTLIMWIYMDPVSVRKTLFEKAGTVYGSYQQEIAMTMETSGQPSYYSRYSATAPGYDNASASLLTQSVWNMMAIKMSTGRTAAARTGFNSLNGAAWSASYNSTTSTALVSAGAIRVGSGYAGTMDSCSVGSVIAYNRMLNDSEILQNFTALRGRFGV